MAALEGFTQPVGRDLGVLCAGDAAIGIADEIAHVR